MLPSFGATRGVCRAGVVDRCAETYSAKRKRLLLARRKYEPWKDHWSFPSGFVEYDEDSELTAVREMCEETGLDVKVDDVFGVYSYFDDPRKNGIIILFSASIVAGELRVDDDTSEVAFFSADSLPERVGFASHRRALRDWVDSSARSGRST
jgi:8-oxo-dGTP diphosphatase